MADDLETAPPLQRRRHRLLAQLLTVADAAGLVDWAVSVDSTVNRAHQHATNLPRTTGGTVELPESLR